MQTLIDSARSKGSALVVGLDPDPTRFPEEINALDVPDHTKVERFCTEILTAVEPFAAAVKLQSAYFERLGPDGMRVYESLIRTAEESGLPTIADVKRGDIDTSARAYAEAHISRFGATAVTVNPYMGEDAVLPFVEEVRKARRGGGVFVLVATSNPSAATIQDSTEPPLYEVVAGLVRDLNSGEASGQASDVGAVVGATSPETAARVRELLPGVLFLAPGFGAQGGGTDSIRPMLDSGENGAGVLVNSSRGILYAFERSGEDYATAAANAAREARDRLRSAGITF